LASLSLVVLLTLMVVLEQHSTIIWGMKNIVSKRV
jgi:hypothetical protein